MLCTTITGSRYSSMPDAAVNLCELLTALPGAADLPHKRPDQLLQDAILMQTYKLCTILSSM